MAIDKMWETYPIPEVIDGKEWEIVDGQEPGKVGENTLVVPLSPDQHDQVRRTHELAHLKWTPKDPLPPDVNPGILAAVEDVRIRALLRRCGISVEPGVPEELVAFQIARLRALKDRWGAMLYRVAMLGLPQEGLTEKALKPESVFAEEPDEAAKMGRDNSELNALRTATGEGTLNFQWTLKWTRRLQKYIKDTREAERITKAATEAALRKPAAEKQALSGFEKRLAEEREAAGRRMREMEDRRREARESASTAKRAASYDVRAEARRMARSHRVDEEDMLSFMYCEYFVPWGKMSIHEPPLVQRLPGRFGHQRRPSDVGTALCYPSRLWQDSKVFGRKLRGYGGSVLIDGSGSMSLSNDQVWAMLKAAPGATIAIYGGHSFDRGTLRILAKRGLVVREDGVTSPGGANIIDLPALEWLAKQQEPRIWVSDGSVTGLGDRSGIENRYQCDALSIRARILRVPHASEAVEILNDIRNRRMGIAMLLEKARKGAA